MIIAALLSILFLQAASDPVDELAAQLVARLVATPASDIVRITPDDDIRTIVNGRGLPLSTRVTVYTLDAMSSEFGYRRLGEVRLRDLPNFAQNAVTQSDIYISFTTSPPRFGLAISAGGQISPDARNLLSSAIVARVAGEAPLVIDDGFQIFGTTFPLIGAELDAIRTRLRNAQLQGLVHAALYRGASSLRLACQIVGSESGDDDLFSIEVALTPELAALLQAMPADGTGDQALMARLPLMDDALAVCALDADGDDNIDIAVLTPGEVLFFHHGEAGLQPFRAISLGNLTPSVYATRAPTGTITPADIDGDGRSELLIASNMFTLGAALYPADGYRLERLSGSPVAAVHGDAQDAVVTGEYVPGTNYLGGRVFIGDGKDNNSGLDLGLEGTIRQLVAVPGGGRGFLVLTREWRLALQADGDRPQSIDVGSGNILAVSVGIGRVSIGLSAVAGGGRIEIGMPSNGRFDAEVSTTTALDIRDLAIYNSAIHSATYIAVLGRENGVGMMLEVRRLPTAVGE